MYKKLDPLLEHILAEHRPPMMTAQTKDRTSCIVGRVAEADERVSIITVLCTPHSSNHVLNCLPSNISGISICLKATRRPRSKQCAYVSRPRKPEPWLLHSAFSKMSGKDWLFTTLENQCRILITIMSNENLDAFDGRYLIVQGCATNQNIWGSRPECSNHGLTCVNGLVV